LVAEFEKLDKDSNGYLDIEELDSLAKMLLREQPEHEKLTDR
jgi:Ca2+-binding EF-hand superfamily protein